jgi:hypothetical protein
MNLLENMEAIRASGENGSEVLPAKDMKHLMVFDLVEKLEHRESVSDDMAADGYGKVITEVLHLVREEGRAAVAGLTVAELLSKVREEVGEDGGELDDYVEKPSETEEGLDGDHVEK